MTVEPDRAPRWLRLDGMDTHGIRTVAQPLNRLIGLCRAALELSGEPDQQAPVLARRNASAQDLMEGAHG